MALPGPPVEPRALLSLLQFSNGASGPQQTARHMHKTKQNLFTYVQNIHCFNTFYCPVAFAPRLALLFRQRSGWVAPLATTRFPRTSGPKLETRVEGGGGLNKAAMDH